MTSQSPRIYTYKITFEEVPYYYYGVHKERKYNEYYMGSPYTHKWVWNFYTPKKQILQLFDFTDEGWLEAQEVEKKLIKPFYNTDKWCLNENCGGEFSIEHQKLAGKNGGNRAKELGVGIHSLTLEDRSRNGKKAKELGLGVFSMTTDELSIAGKKGREKAKELGVGIYAFTLEQKIEYGKKGALTNKQNNTGLYGRSIEEIRKHSSIGGKESKRLKKGIHGISKEQKSENSRKGGKIGGKLSSKIMNSQKWLCLETGYITTSGPLTLYQKARGIDTSKRKRIA